MVMVGLAPSALPRSLRLGSPLDADPSDSGEGQLLPRVPPRVKSESLARK